MGLGGVLGLLGVALGRGSGRGFGTGRLGAGGSGSVVPPPFGIFAIF